MPLPLDPLLQAMPVGFMAVDRAWRITHVNPSAEAVLGKARPDLVGADFWETFPDNRTNEFGRIYREVMETGVPQRIEAYYPEPLNAWFEAHAVAVETGLALYFTDVTGRRTAQNRLAMLARVGARLTGTLDVAEAIRRIPRLLIPELGDGCLLTVVDDSGRPRDAGSWHVEPGKRDVLVGYAERRLAALPANAPVLRSLLGETVVAPGEETYRALSDPGARDAFRRLGTPSVATIPLLGNARVVGALTLLLQSGRLPGAEDLLTAREVADRVGLALHNAWLFDQHKQLAEGLQRRLLSAPVEPDDAEVVVRYTPAAEAARVGGDWHDSFRQPCGATVLVIGDVVGHDTAAAAAMGQVRSLLRGIAAYSDAGPAEVLRGVDAAMTQLEVGTYATAAVARFERCPDGGTRMRWSNAGHLPLLVVDPAGEVRQAGPWRGERLLGSGTHNDRSEAVLDLAPGTTVLMVTDGLIERRDSDLDAGMAQLSAVVAELAARPLAELCDELIDRLVSGRPEDDVAVVAIRLAG
ncbi:SpoIIE family protein phosphatase [Blastococcus sp. TF02A_35]|uniref:SpoIIE family protein phosphatase n=1 Tax=Blastococcus sp. TF02A-35 TaxID=2559612 RepID=UPI001073D265|nr:SpoIIE family protein phosphatase [Blastococcus sp. TF02A_35]TFV46259.1 PAS domain-containing protein [Blastococcus sp. TF02A_35]